MTMVKRQYSTAMIKLKCNYFSNSNKKKIQNCKLIKLKDSEANQKHLSCSNYYKLLVMINQLDR